MGNRFLTLEKEVNTFRASRFYAKSQVVSKRINRRRSKTFSRPEYASMYQNLVFGQTIERVDPKLLKTSK